METIVTILKWPRLIANFAFAKKKVFFRRGSIFMPPHPLKAKQPYFSLPSKMFWLISKQKRDSSVPQQSAKILRNKSLDWYKCWLSGFHFDVLIHFFTAAKIVYFSDLSTERGKLSSLLLKARTHSISLLVFLYALEWPAAGNALASNEKE